MTVRWAVLLAVASLLPAAAAAAVSAGGRGGVDRTAVEATVARLVARFGEGQGDRIRLGVGQVAARWWDSDGDAVAFSAFCEENFITDRAELRATFDRMQEAGEMIAGRLHEIGREMRRPFDLETGPLGKADRFLGELNLGAHVEDDLYRTRAAFLALLNFPIHSLQDRLSDGPSWQRETWARSRMMDGYAVRVPPEVYQRVSRTLNDADLYVSRYYIQMGSLVAADGRRLFPEGLRLITHWGLRDELKSQYDQGRDGLERQRAIRRVMERIVCQEIPDAVRDNPDLLWCPETNAVTRRDGSKADPKQAAREPDTRYAKVLGVFRALREIDPYAPTAPTAVARKFQLDRQISEAEVEALLVSVLDSPEIKEVAALIRKRLGRELEPFDIWYPGFSGRPPVPQADLDAKVRERYPSAGAFQADLPRILAGLGFSEDKARFLAERIVVDPSRGAGHAQGAAARDDKAHLRTHVSSSGMNYKGYNIAIHELGHNVEQVFSLNGIDHWYLSGVPNNAFTEAFAFSFQARDLELLGYPPVDEAARRVETLGALWDTYEIGGVSLVELETWRWLYGHPEATPAELRDATLAAARRIWNRYYAPVLGSKDSEILAVYAHTVAYPLYLPDYPIGHIIAFQVGEKLRGADFGKEFERMARQGRLTPDAWMRGATGSPISTKPLIESARRALDGVRD